MANGNLLGLSDMVDALDLSLLRKSAQALVVIDPMQLSKLLVFGD